MKSVSARIGRAPDRAILGCTHYEIVADMFRAARSLLTAGKLSAGFKHIIVDEIQDFHPQAFRLLRAQPQREQVQAR